MQRSDKEYYIVSVTCYEVKAYNGSVLTEAGTIAWLGEADGYTQVGSKGNAEHFKKPPTESEIARWDGMPWYYRLKPGSAKIYKVTECMTKEYTEKLVEPEHAKV